MEDDLQKEKSKRTAVRTLTTKLITKIETVFNDSEMSISDKIEELSDLYNQLSEKNDSLKECNSKIELKLKAADISAEITTSEEYSEKIIKWKGRINRFLKQNDIKVNSKNSIDLNDSLKSEKTVEANVKLPKININKYYGSPTNWLEFWGQYKISVHENGNLTDIQKFVYLKTLLGGSALNSIRGFDLTEENYSKSIEILKQNFGRSDIIINSHMNKLLNLEAVRNSHNIKALRNLYEDCETSVRNLDSLGVASGSYGQLLASILLKLLPDDLNLEFQKQRRAEAPLDVLSLLKFLREEIQSREAAASVNDTKRVKQNQTENKKYGTRYNTPTAATFSTNVKFNCIFCLKSHDSFCCNELSAAKKREKLKKERRCFACFKKFHISSFCKSSIDPCKKCNSKFHNESICMKNQMLENKNDSEGIENSNSVLISTLSHCKFPRNRNNTVYLQTCIAKAISPSKSKIVTILMDSASTQSFVTKTLAEQLNLPIIREENLAVYTFGSREPIRKSFPVVKIILESTKECKNQLSLELLVSDHITNSYMSPLSLEVKNLLKSKMINLTDLCVKASNNVNILLGADNYFKVNTGNIQRLNDSLTLVETIFGNCILGAENKNNKQISDLCLFASF